MFAPTHPKLIFLFLVVALGSVACQDHMMAGDGFQQMVADTSADVTLGYEGHTTNGLLAAQNLSSQIQGRAVIARSRPSDPLIGQELVALLLSRAHYLGTYSDFQEAMSVANEMGLETNDSDDAKLMNARVYTALHEFAAAKETLASMREPTRASLELLANIHIATSGDLAWVRTERQGRADAYPNFQNLSAWAVAESALGHYEKADTLYIRALEAYGDVSPLPVAWVQFQRGVMWAESADQPEKALPLYREAVARLPGYVVANVHLAELEAELGQRSSAIHRLRSLIAQTEDPEPAGLLGEILLRDNPEEALVYIEQARAMYNDLLDLHPHAFADHGAEFFSGPGGDPERALSLALGNLERRPTPRAYTVAMEVAESAGEQDIACRLAREVDFQYVNVVLDRLTQQMLSRCN